MPVKNSPQGDNEDAEFQRVLAEVESSLAALQERYAQIQRDHQTKSVLKTELRQIHQQLEEIELNLESRLLSWSSFKEPLWQAVRFGGMGVIVGWILKSCAS